MGSKVLQQYVQIETWFLKCRNMDQELSLSSKITVNVTQWEDPAHVLLLIYFSGGKPHYWSLFAEEFLGHFLRAFSSSVSSPAHACLVPALTFPGCLPFSPEPFPSLEPISFKHLFSVTFELPLLPQSCLSFLWQIMHISLWFLKEFIKLHQRSSV